MTVLRSTLRTGLALAIVLPLMATSVPAQAKNNTGALIGGLVAGALVGGIVAGAAAQQPKTYYYAPPPPPPPPVYYAPRPAPVYAPGYCGAPPYPPCRTPIY